MNISNSSEWGPLSYSITPLKLAEPSYLTVYEWEKSFDLQAWREWMLRNWTISIYAAILYIFCIFWGQNFMQSRKPLRLTPLLFAWNTILAIFSIGVLVRTAPEFFHVLTAKNGFHNSVCHWMGHNHATAFWSWLFTISKVVELGDTAFVVLRKQKLLFLHWYHHAVTLISVWLVYEAYEPHQQWSVVMNSFIHSIMYTYYALKAVGVFIPRKFSVAITALQLLQMLVGILVSLYSLNILVHGHGLCDRAYFGHQVPLFIYMTYLLLFAHFFYSAYLKSSNKPPRIEKSAIAKKIE